MSELNVLPLVARMEGVRLEPHGPQIKAAEVIAQYTDEAGQWHELRMPYLDGMYLLELLAAVAGKTGYQPGGGQKR